MSPWKVILATMVIFGCGVVTGGLLVKTTMPPASVVENPARVPISSTNVSAIPLNQIQRLEFLRRMEKQLDLTTNQYDQIQKIMKDSQDRTRKIWEEKIGGQMRDEYRHVRQEIMEILNPDQRQKMNELLHSRRPPPGERATRSPASNSLSTTNGT